MSILNKKDRNHEKGNVLFLILIAVALFAALSYAVTQSTRTGGGNSDGETALISSAQLTQYPASVRTAVVRMILGGIDANDLEFNAPSDFAGCTASGSISPYCVFHPTGGGATYAYAPTDFMAAGAGNTSGTWVFNAENEIDLIGLSGGTSGSADLIAFLPGITETLCNRINKELGLSPTTPPTETAIDFATQMDDGVGVFSNSTAAYINGGSNELRGQPYGCFNQGGTYVYYHVLVER